MKLRPTEKDFLFFPLTVGSSKVPLRSRHEQRRRRLRGRRRRRRVGRPIGRSSGQVLAQRRGCPGQKRSVVNGKA